MSSSSCYSRLYIAKHDSFISRYVVFVSLNIISYSVFELNMLYNVYLFWRERVLVDFYNSDKTFFFKQMGKKYTLKANGLTFVNL